MIDIVIVDQIISNLIYDSVTEVDIEIAKFYYWIEIMTNIDHNNMMMMTKNHHFYQM